MALQAIELGEEADHVHRLVTSHPALNLSVSINNLKTVNARRVRIRFTEHLVAFYPTKPLFWHRADVDAQGTEELARKALEKARTKIKPPA